jgi:predicted O-methyltransferase YrrM
MNRKYIDGLLGADGAKNKKYIDGLLGADGKANKKYIDGLLGTDGETAAIRELAAKDGIPILQAAAANFLELLVRLKAPEKILEIGAAIGYSGIVMLMAAGGQARLNTIEQNEQSIKIARSNFEKFGLRDRVNIFCGDAGAIIPTLSGAYDFIFLDGAKGQYINYLPYLTDLLARGGTLVCDNVLFRGMVADDALVADGKRTLVNNMRAFLTRLCADKRLHTAVIDIGDGVSVSYKL